MTPDRPTLRPIAAGREAEILQWDERCVVRLYRDARHPRAVAHEVAAMEAVRQVLPVVPEVHGVVEIAGRPGIVIDRVDGPDLLSLVERDPGQAATAGRITAEVHARIHAVVAPPTLPDLRGAVAARLVRGQLPPVVTTRALALLDRLPDGDRLCHGDLHPGNVILAERGPVVIDWQHASCGDPHADFVRTRLLVACGALSPGTSASSE